MWFQEFYLLAKAYAYLMDKDQAILSVAVAAPVNIVESSYNIPEMAKYIPILLFRIIFSSCFIFVTLGLHINKNIV